MTNNSAFLTEREPWSKRFGRKIRDSTLDMLNVGFLWDIQGGNVLESVGYAGLGLRREVC